MSTQLTNGSQQETNMNDSTRQQLIAGLALIALGALALLPRFIEIDNLQYLFLPALAFIFLAWGLASRNFGFLIPGGILAGIGLGAILVEGLMTGLSENAEGSVFLLSFAAGWALISLLSPLTRSGFQWWPLIPGGILAAIGAILAAGETGMAILQIIGIAWPLALIAGGIWLIFKRTR